MSSEEIIKVLNEFKPKKSCDYYEISIQLLKCIFHVLVYPFVLLINLSFESGIVHDILKILSYYIKLVMITFLIIIVQFLSPANSQRF